MKCVPNNGILVDVCFTGSSSAFTVLQNKERNNINIMYSKLFTTLWISIYISWSHKHPLIHTSVTDVGCQGRLFYKQTSNWIPIKSNYNEPENLAN